MTDNNAPWFKQPIFWMLMTGPIIVVIAGFVTFWIAQSGHDDMVTDDYYKEGKYINMQIERDVEASKRHITAQVLFNDDGSAAKVFVSGDFDRTQPLNLLMQHPAQKALDQIVRLKAANSPTSGDKAEYLAVLKPLGKAIHWYVRVEDEAGKWRVEKKWLPSQGAAVNLEPEQRTSTDSVAK